MQYTELMITYKIKPDLSDLEIKPLFKAAWPDEDETSYEGVLRRSLSYVCAYDPDRAEGHLIGFVNVAWDGGVHAFLLDTTVHPDYRRRGIATELVRRATREAKGAGCDWLHVDYDAHLQGFYEGCGFRPSLAGLIHLREAR